MTTDTRTGPVLELRLVLTVDDFEAALRFYRDALGLPQEAEFASPDGRVVLLAAGRATLEISDRDNAAQIDRIEVGRVVPTPIRVALQVADTAAVTANLGAAGASVLGPPRATPFNSINARLVGPEGLQLTLFQHGGGQPEAWGGGAPEGRSTDKG